MPVLEFEHCARHASTLPLEQPGSQEFQLRTDSSLPRSLINEALVESQDFGDRRRDEYGDGHGPLLVFLSASTDRRSAAGRRVLPSVDRRTPRRQALLGGRRPWALRGNQSAAVSCSGLLGGSA